MEISNAEKEILKNLTNKGKRSAYVRNKENWELIERLDFVRVLEFKRFGMDYIRVEIYRVCPFNKSLNEWSELAIYKFVDGKPTSSFSEIAIQEELTEIRKRIIAEEKKEGKK